MVTNGTNADQTFLTEHDVAAILNVSVATIRRRRLFKRPPDWIKIGASVRYKREAVLRFVDSNEFIARKG
jgi:hypothetical protein